MNVEYRMSVREYEELTPYAADLEDNWGKAPGHLNSDGQNLLVFGAKYGNVFIGVQPTFGYEVSALPGRCSASTFLLNFHTPPGLRYSCPLQQAVSGRYASVRSN